MINYMETAMFFKHMETLSIFNVNILEQNMITLNQNVFVTIKNGLLERNNLVENISHFKFLFSQSNLTRI